METNNINFMAQKEAAAKTADTEKEQEQHKYNIVMQKAFMECWIEALNDPIGTRVIIETDIQGYRQTWTDKEGNTHEYDEYFMIDGSDGERRNQDGKWMWSSSEGRNTDAYINADEVLPRALSVISSGRVTAIYNDVY